MLEPVVHFLEMEVERAELLQFAGIEMFRYFGSGFKNLDEIRIVATGMFDLPRLHRGVLHKLVSRFARQTLFDEGEQDGL